MWKTYVGCCQQREKDKESDSKVREKFPQKNISKNNFKTAKIVKNREALKNLHFWPPQTLPNTNVKSRQKSHHFF